MSVLERVWNQPSVLKRDFTVRLFCFPLFFKGSKESGVLATAFSAFTVPAGDSNSDKMGMKRRKDTNSSQRHKHCSVSPSLETEWDRKSDIFQIRELGNKWSTTHTEENANPTSSQLDVCRRKFSRLRKKLLWFVERKEFEGFITFCIAANTIFMATEHHGMSSSLETVIAVSNYVSCFFNNPARLLLMVRLVRVLVVQWLAHRTRASPLRPGFDSRSVQLSD